MSTTIDRPRTTTASAVWSIAHNQHVRLLGLITLPDIVSANADLADRLSDFHSWAAWGMLALVISHIGAALWHHYGRRDNVLLSMLPTGPRGGRGDRLSTLAGCKSTRS